MLIMEENIKNIKQSRETDRRSDGFIPLDSFCFGFPHHSYYKDVWDSQFIHL